MSKRAPWELRGKDAFNEVDYENGTMLGAVLYGDETCPVCKGRGKVVQTLGGLQPAR
jgi:hypothetical protein